MICSNAHLLLIKEIVLLWKTIPITACLLIRFTYTHVVYFIHLFVWSSRCISFLHIKSIFSMVPSFLKILLLFCDTWLKMTNLFYQFNLLLSLLFPTHYIIRWLPGLKSLQHSFIINHNSIEFFVSHYFVQRIILNRLAHIILGLSSRNILLPCVEKIRC